MAVSPNVDSSIAVAVLVGGLLPCLVREQELGQQVEPLHSSSWKQPFEVSASTCHVIQHHYFIADDRPGIWPISVGRE
jgi:hypothetical protein